jgi:hypothetical protein
VPWTARDAARHVDGLTPHQAQIWSRVANRALAACRASGGSADECDSRAIRQANAVAQRGPKKSIKSLGGNGLDILAVPFGLDWDGEYFSDRTDLCLDWFPTQRPLLYEHGLSDDGPGVTAIGHVDAGSARKSDEGWWVRAELDRQHKYFRQIEQLLEEEALFASSGAMPHLVRKSRDGEILRWPWVEQSLTPVPANLLSLVQPAEAKAHYKSAGLTPPPTLDPDETRSYAELLDRLTDDLGDFTDLTKRLGEGRLKVGRPQFSESRRQRLGTLLERLRESAAEIEGLLSETERAAQEEAAAETEAGPEAEHKTKDRTDPQDQPQPAAHAPELVALRRDFQTLDTLFGHLAVATTTPR